LVGLTLHRARITNALAQPQFPASSSLNWYGYQEYRARLCFSLDGLLEAQAISARLAENVRGTFGQFREVWPHRGQLTFVHGDFSYGNLRLHGEKLVLLDLEHSHIGVGAIDLAHLYVNLAVQQEAEPAEQLLYLMKERCEHAGVEFSRQPFRAAVLERVTGKMNSMSNTRGEKWEKLETLLVAYTEDTG
jgi:thiamine kinase-like enzyme